MRMARSAGGTFLGTRESITASLRKRSNSSRQTLHRSRCCRIWTRSATRAAPAKDAGLHGADAAFENFGDFFVTQAFEVAQNHGATKNAGNLLQSAVDGRLNFQRGQLLERRGAEIL